VAWAPDYATATELGAYVRVHDTLDATEMASAVTAASRSIDDYCKRQFGKVDAAQARYYTAFWSTVDLAWKVEIEDLMVTTDLEILVDDAGAGTYTSEIAAADVVFEPLNAVVEGRPWELVSVRLGSAVQPPVHRYEAGVPRGYNGGIKITAIWGWSAVPSAVKYAALLQASRFLTRRDSPYGVAGSPPRRDSGSGISVAAKELRLMDNVDPDVAASLEPFRRDWHIA
jgi:hypothetical protein